MESPNAQPMNTTPDKTCSPSMKRSLQDAFTRPLPRPVLKRFMRVMMWKELGSVSEQSVIIAAQATIAAPTKMDTSLSDHTADMSLDDEDTDFWWADDAPSLPSSTPQIKSASTAWTREALDKIARASSNPTVIKIWEYEKIYRNRSFTTAEKSAHPHIDKMHVAFANHLKSVCMARTAALSALSQPLPVELKLNDIGLLVSENPCIPSTKIDAAFLAKIRLKSKDELSALFTVWYDVHRRTCFTCTGTISFTNCFSLILTLLTRLISPPLITMDKEIHPLQDGSTLYYNNTNPRLFTKATNCLIYFRKMAFAAAFRAMLDIPAHDGIIRQMENNSGRIVLDLQEDEGRLRALPPSNLTKKICKTLQKLKTALNGFNEFNTSRRAAIRDGKEFLDAADSYHCLDEVDYFNILTVYHGLYDAGKKAARKNMIYAFVFDEILEIQMGKYQYAIYFIYPALVHSSNLIALFFRPGKVAPAKENGGVRCALDNHHQHLRITKISISERMAAFAATEKTAALTVATDEYYSSIGEIRDRAKYFQNCVYSICFVDKFPLKAHWKYFPAPDSTEWSKLQPASVRPTDCPGCSIDGVEIRKTCCFLRGGACDKLYYMALADWATNKAGEPVNTAYIRLNRDAGVPSAFLAGTALMHLMRTIARGEDLDWMSFRPVLFQDAPTRHIVLFALENKPQKQEQLRKVFNTLLQIWPKAFKALFPTLLRAFPLEIGGCLLRGDSPKWDFACAGLENFDSDLNPHLYGEDLDERKHLNLTAGTIARYARISDNSDPFINLADIVADILFEYKEARKEGVESTRLAMTQIQVLLTKIITDICTKAFKRQTIVTHDPLFRRTSKPTLKSAPPPDEKRKRTLPTRPRHPTSRNTPTTVPRLKSSNSNNQTSCALIKTALIDHFYFRRMSKTEFMTKLFDIKNGFFDRCYPSRSAFEIELACSRSILSEAINTGTPITDAEYDMIFRQAETIWDSLGLPDDRYEIAKAPFAERTPASVPAEWSNQLGKGKTAVYPLGILIRFDNPDDREQRIFLSALINQIKKIPGGDAISKIDRINFDRLGARNLRFKTPENADQLRAIGDVVSRVQLGSFNLPKNAKAKFKIHHIPLHETVDQHYYPYCVGLRFTDLDDNKGLSALEDALAKSAPTLCGARMSNWNTFRYDADDDGSLNKNPVAEALFHPTAVAEIVLAKQQALDPNQPLKHRIKLIENADIPPRFCSLCLQWSNHSRSELGMTVCTTKGKCRFCLDPIEHRQVHRHEQECEGANSPKCARCQSAKDPYDHAVDDLIHCPRAFPAFEAECAKRRRAQRIHNSRFAAQITTALKRQGVDDILAWLDAPPSNQQSADRQATALKWGGEIITLP